MVSRNLTQEEITRLQAQGCSSTDWQRVKVASGFKTDYIQNVRFSGDIELGIFDYEFILEDSPDMPVCSMSPYTTVGWVIMS